MRSGLPERIEEYTVVELDGLKVYVPKSASFTEEVVNIVDFTRRNGRVSVGVIVK